MASRPLERTFDKSVDSIQKVPINMGGPSVVPLVLLDTEIESGALSWSALGLTANGEVLRPATINCGGARDTYLQWRVNIEPITFL